MEDEKIGEGRRAMVIDRWICVVVVTIFTGEIGGLDER
jgi:hypothetical protein